MTATPSVDLSRVALLVVSYGPCDLLERTIVPTARDVAPGVVVVVDSFSTTTAREALASMAAREGWTFVATDTNVGFGAGMNLAAARALELGAGRFILLNPDARLERPDAIALMGAVEEHPRALVAPKIVTSDGSPWSSGVTDLLLDTGRMRSASRRRPTEGAVRRLEWLSGACLALSAELWQEVEGFDPDYFLYWEDVDLSRKVAEVGGTVLVVPEAVAVHDEGGTHEDRPRSARAKSPTYYRYSLRNRMLFATKHLSDGDVRRWLRAAPCVAWEVLLEGGRRQLVTGLAPWRAAARGTMDGVRLARRRLR